MQDWNKFNSLISTENINLNEIQMYVESINNNNLLNNNNLINPSLIQSQQSSNL